jgi:hypothetical protein
VIAHQLESTIPTTAAVTERLQIIEERYGVSLKFWLSFEPNAAGVMGIRVLGTGSGELFDLLGPDDGVVSSVVSSGWAGSILPSLWYILNELERRFWQVESHRTTRPSL